MNEKGKKEGRAKNERVREIREKGDTKGKKKKRMRIEKKWRSKVR